MMLPRTVFAGRRSSRSGIVARRPLLDVLEPRRMFCAAHEAHYNDPAVELRPDLLALQQQHGGQGVSDANDPADIVWINRGTATSDTDGFNARFGAAAATARAVADAVIVAYERMIVSFNYATAGQTYNLTVNMSAANSGFGASASLTQYLAAKPKGGTINMGAGTGATGTGNGWFLDPTPYESSEFQGTIVNEFSGNAQTGSPAAGKGDFYTVFAAELTHCMGLFGNGSSLWSSHTTASTVSDTAEGGGTGKFFTFSGPSIQHLLTSNNGGSGGSDFNAAIHSAGPITTTIGGVTYNGAQDQGNAVYENGRRYLVNNAFSLMFKDAYGYSSVDPAKYGTFYSTLNETTGVALVRGGLTTSADNVTITRAGNKVIVSVDVGTDVAGTGALPGPGNLPAFVTEYDVSQLTGGLDIQTGDGADTITLGANLGINISVNGGNGIDTLAIAGTAGDDALAYAGTTASAGVTSVSLISAVENVAFDGGAGTDTLTIAGTTGSDSITVTPGAFGGARAGTFANVESLVVNALAGSDTVNVNAPLLDVTVDAGGGVDSINVVETAPGYVVRSATSTLNAATLTVNVNADGNGTATFDVGAGGTSVASLAIASGGTVGGAGDLTVTNALQWSGGAMTGAGRTILASTAGGTISDPTHAKTLGRSLQNGGSLNFIAGTILVDAGADLINDGTFATNAAADEVVSIDPAAPGSAGAFVNNGTVNAGGVDGSTVVTVAFNNAGVVNDAARQLALRGGGVQTGTFNVAAGATLATDGAHAFNSGSNISGAGTLAIDGGTLALAPGLSSTTPAVVVGGLTLASGAALDVADNALVVDYDATSPIAAIAALIAAGYAGGTWTGDGIRSSTAAATPARAVGYGEASTLFGAFPATFAGASVDDTSVLIRYTIAGDANLSRTVDFDDLLILAQNYGQTGRTFAQGDFDYSADGTVDFADLLILSQQYGQSLAVVNATAAPMAVKRKTRASVGNSVL